MLLSFSVANYRSFRAEQTLSLLASKRLGKTAGSPHCHDVPGTDEHAIRVCSLYGANGAGKSNLVRALAVVKRLVVSGTPAGQNVGYDPFLLDAQSHAQPTTFELQFLQDGEVFRYGFCYDSRRIHEEWLDVYRGTKERSLFSRTSEEGRPVKVDLGPAAGSHATSKKMKLLADLGARPNQLFLTELTNLDDPEAQGPDFSRAVNWFTSNLLVISPGATYRSLARTILEDEAFAAFAGAFLREASTGIAGLDVKVNFVPAEVLEEAGRIEEARQHADPETGLVKVRKIRAVHDYAEGRRTELPLNRESDGSQRLLHLLPALYYLKARHGVVVIDEIERSMHPMLARKFIEFFLNAAKDMETQLIFTTHETNLLDLNLVRRDGIWFAEKDDQGATQLYSLADFKVRKDLRIEKGYLAGRFGAIPFLGGIDRLIEEQGSTGKEG
jgi:hypothetical protein